MMKSKHLEHLPKDEVYNVLTHGFGLFIFLVGLPLLYLKYLSRSWTGIEMLGLSAFGLGLLAVYTSSTGYHYFTGSRKIKWRILDHIAIYYLIGGSYTAYLLRYYYVSDGVMLLIIQWSIILIGTILKLYFTGKFNLLSTLLYVILGWMVLPIVGSLSEAVPMDVSLWIVAGGVSYSIGVVFYLMERLPYHHPIWHLFVLGGSLCHFLGLYLGE